MRYQADTATHRKPTTLRMTRGQFSGRPDKQRIHRTTLRTKRTHQVSARQKDKPADDKNEDRSRFNVFQLGLEAQGRWARAQGAARIGSTLQLGLEARRSSGWKHKADGRPGAARVGSTPQLGLGAQGRWAPKEQLALGARHSSGWKHAAARVGSTREMGARGAARIGSTPQLGLEAQGRGAPKEQLALGARHSSGWKHKADGRPRSSSHWEHATASAPTK